MGQLEGAGSAGLIWKPEGRSKTMGPCVYRGAKCVHYREEEEGGGGSTAACAGAYVRAGARRLRGTENKGPAEISAS